MDYFRFQNSTFGGVFEPVFTLYMDTFVKMETSETVSELAGVSAGVCVAF